jgi:translation initiation factor IF-3
MMMRRLFGGSFPTLPYHKLNHPRCCVSGRAVSRGGGNNVMVASSQTCSSSISVSSSSSVVVVSTLPSLLLDNNNNNNNVTNQKRLPLRPKNLPLTRGIGLAKHRGNFSTLARVEDTTNTTTSSSTGNANSEDVVSALVDDNDDDDDEEEEDTADEENGDLDEDVSDDEDVVDDSNDEDGQADNDAIRSNRNNYDEYFSNINVDDITSLELPPNPDIPPPKVRNWSPIAPTPTTNNKQNQKSRNSQRAAALNVLANDRLVTQIMKNLKQHHQKGGTTPSNNGHQSNKMTADGIQVRVVPDPLLVKIQKAMENEPTTATTTSTKALPPQHKPMVMTLSEAIKMSIEQQKDLVEVSIDQEIPVVTISNMKGMAYQSAKSKKSSKGSNAASSQIKEVTMQAGIASNDLQRKVNDIFKFLEKGHMCTVSIRINRRQSRTNVNAPEDAIQRILPLFTAAEDQVEMVVPPEVNPLRTMVSFRVRAATKKK